jgi:hypothetical protein
MNRGSLAQTNGHASSIFTMPNGLRWIAFSRLLKILAEFLLKPRQGVEQRLKG